MKENNLDEEKLDQIRKDLESGMKLLAANHPDWDRNDPSETMDLLCEGIADGTVFMLEAAAILIDCLERATDWKLVSLAGERSSGAAVVSPDGAYAIYPELVVARAFRNPGGSSLKDHFDMIKGESLPPSSPGGYAVLG